MYCLQSLTSFSSTADYLFGDDVERLKNNILPNVVFLSFACPQLYCKTDNHASYQRIQTTCNLGYIQNEP